MFEPGSIYSLVMSNSGSPDDVSKSSWEVIKVNLPLVKFYNDVLKEERIINTASLYFISATFLSDDGKKNRSFWEMPEAKLP